MSGERGKAVPPLGAQVKKASPLGCPRAGIPCKPRLPLGPLGPLGRKHRVCVIWKKWKFGQRVCRIWPSIAGGGIGRPRRSAVRRQLSRASAIMRIEGVADFTRSPWSCAGSWWARGPKHGRSLATARRGAMSNIGKAAFAHLTRDKAYAVETSEELARFGSSSEWIASSSSPAILSSWRNRWSARSTIF